MTSFRADGFAGMTAVLTEAVLLDNQASIFELLQSRVNGFYLDTALSTAKSRGLSPSEKISFGSMK